MKGDKALEYLASRVAQLELEKAILLAQLEELKQIKKEVEQYANTHTASHGHGKATESQHDGGES